MSIYIPWDWSTKYSVPYRDCYTHQILKTINQYMIISLRSSPVLPLWSRVWLRGRRWILLLLNNSFVTICLLGRFHTASYTRNGSSLDDDYNPNDCIVKISKPQAFENFTASLSRLELLEEQKYGQVYHLILTTKASVPSSLRRQHPLLSGLQKIVISHDLWGRLCTMMHFYNVTGHPGVTQMFAAPKAKLLLATDWRWCNLCCSSFLALCKKMGLFASAR